MLVDIVLGLVQSLASSLYIDLVSVGTLPSSCVRVCVCVRTSGECMCVCVCARVVSACMCVCVGWGGIY